MIPRIALTPGEPAGIGPDLAVMIASRGCEAELVAIADPELLEQRARMLRLPLQLQPYHPERKPEPTSGGRLLIEPVRLGTPAQPGRPDPANARYVLDSLRRACTGCQSGEFAAMVTAPVQKSVINDAGFPFSGHTEFLAGLTESPQPLMLLVAGTLRVALLTTHLPLREVAGQVTAERIISAVQILHDGLRSRFGIDAPRIAVLALNPHAGESGHLGSEEIEILAPAIESLRAHGLAISGPLPADSAFTPERLTGYDAVLAMYHDQGLPVLKHVGFGAAVNVTLGLPIIRTSVDHGTALELAGTGRADPGSLAAAVALAADLARRRAV
jgi:4-hydroxythreonine-4-phosphate dehydrogenase